MVDIGIDEGTIKYRCEWIEEDAIALPTVTDLTRYRDALHQLHLIGEYPNGIGFGNLSQKTALPPSPISYPLSTLPNSSSPAPKPATSPPSPPKTTPSSPISIQIKTLLPVEA